jgi:hypothetical protein
MEDDSLRPLLREWEAPEAPPAMDARIRAAYRAAYPAPPRWNFWSARVSVQVPVLAAAMLVLLAFALQFRSEPPTPTRGGRAYITQVDAEGFQPLPNGAARVVRLEGIPQ